jgi:hypothetical protein
MFGFGGKKSTSQEQNALIDATAGDEGISALGGLSTLSIKTTPKPEQLTETQKDNISQLFGNEEDYLILPGAEKNRPRSAVLTHTIGMAVTVGGGVGALTGAVSNWNMLVIKSPIERSKFITMIVRRIRNNAIRFGMFATLFSSAGVALEIMLRPSNDHVMPTQEEIYDMELKGISYQPPEQEPIDENTQQHITTAGILLAAVGTTTPKTLELWRKAGKIGTLAQAQTDAGVMEAYIMKQWGKKAAMTPVQLSQSLKRLAAGKMVGVVGVALLIDYMWRKQMHDKINKTVRKFSSSVY